MPVTFEEARAIVADSVLPDWPAENGTPVVRDFGFEDATHWNVLVDTVEDLVICGDPAYLVSKTTGEIEEVMVVSALGRFRAMTPVGEHPGEHPGEDQVDHD